MKTKQIVIHKGDSHSSAFADAFSTMPQLALVFGSVELFDCEEIRADLRKAADAGCLVVGCSTAGEISDSGVSDQTLVLTTVRFEHARLQVARSRVTDMGSSFNAGKELAAQIRSVDLKAAMIFSKGLEINGSALVRGLQEVLGPEVLITGGLAGDSTRFQRTLVMLNGEALQEEVLAIGISGKAARISFGTQGGWQPFGPIRRVSRAEGNVLFELDNKPALSIYKEYLGESSAALPSSALLFPLAILKDDRDTTGIIRTVLAVDENAQSMTFAGELPANGLVRLMHAPEDAIVEGARVAAESASGPGEGGLAILISCVGRKLVLGNDVDEEIEAVRGVLGRATVFTGFYSYGEICPQEKGGFCHLHNQTMTITRIYEDKEAA